MLSKFVAARSPTLFFSVIDYSTWSRTSDFADYFTQAKKYRPVARVFAVTHSGLNDIVYFIQGSSAAEQP